MFALGYNTNGLAHHRLEDALPLLADLGYQAVALTPDVGQLDPFNCSAQDVAKIRGLASDLGLRIVIETGARYLMDPVRKHFPTLLEPEAAQRRQRVDFLERCVALAVGLEAPLLSIWSGCAPGGALASDPQPGDEVHWERLCAGVREILERTTEAEIDLAFEPEPGMFIQRPAEFLELRERLGADGDALWMTLDVGHLVVTGDLPVGEVIRNSAPFLRNVHLDDCPAGVHVHGPFGSGDLDLQAALRALVEVGYGGVASVELSRDSHRGAAAAAQAMSQLRSVLDLRP